MPPVDRIAEMFGDNGDDDRYRGLALWLNLERERHLGEPLDPERVVADIDLLANGEIEEYELQAITRELEGAVGETCVRRSRRVRRGSSPTGPASSIGGLAGLTWRS